jgi:hypothetical protein
MRVTKVNALGRPVYGANSFVVTSGFVSVQFTPEIAEGEETEVRTASGELCVSERGCDELRWITVQIEFCQVDPCLFTLINETWTELRDCVGEVIGWAESHKFSCDTGFAMELWTDVTGYTPTTPGAQGAWGYLLLPFIVGGTLGEQTVENGAISFTISGRTKKGSGWGVGPYDIMCNDATTGACGPLLTPVGTEEPRRIMLTTCPPPTAACGCQPLSSPDGAPLTVTEDTTDASRMSVNAEVAAGTTGTYRVSWGDGTVAQDIIPGTPLNHEYDRPGTYTVSVWDSTNTQRVSVQPVTVPFTGAVVPAIDVTQDTSDATRRTAHVTVTNPQAGRTYEVQWQAGGDWDDIPSGGATPNQLSHAYPAPDGTKAITVRDKMDPTKSVTENVTIPYPAPVTPTLLVTEQGGDATRRTTRVTVTNPQPSINYEISWAGAGGPFTAMPTTGTVTATNQQAAGATMDVVVRQVGLTTNSASQTVALPWTGPVFTITEGGTDMEGSITVTGGSTYEADWEDTAIWVALTGGSGTHTYTSAGTYEVKVRDATTTTDVATQQATVPFTGVLFVAAVPDDQGDGGGAGGDTSGTRRKRSGS